MLPTDELVRKLRRYVNESIPTGGSAADTSFSEDDVTDIITDADSIYAAAAQGWRLKAASSPSTAGQVKKYSIGQETYEKTTASDYASYCLVMAKMYDGMAEKADTAAGSRILTVRRPDVT